MRHLIIAVTAILLILPRAIYAEGYGSINNFDAVNDNGVPCHGFEIEIEDVHSTDITYTYDWNHYGTPRITEDNSDPMIPKVFIRYESPKNTDGTWAAFTAVPAGPVSPTDGHQFTDPSVNFGGEHFGVGFYGVPKSVKYNWLIDDGSGNLIHGTAVNIATPSFAYYPPANALPAQVQAAIVPPPPPAPPAKEFGEASWVKLTRTETHNNNKVELRDLVDDDPDDPNDRNWTNGEPDEVEVEWQILQTDYNSTNGGANGELVSARQNLPDGDEIITIRYDFFKYVGPLDPETGEALEERVGPDGLHGTGEYADVVVVGDYIGAQMAGFDAQGQIGLIDHLQDGERDVPYVDRTIVIGGTAPILTTRSGDLPEGMIFNEATGVLSGTPTIAGTFTFTIHSIDANAGDVTTTYNLTIVDPGVIQPLHISVTAEASPPEGGSASGSGEYTIGENVTVVATENPGFAFVNWTDGGTEVSKSPSYDFSADVNRELVANFITVSEGEILAEGEVAVEGEGEMTVEGEGEVMNEGEGEVPAEGEGEVMNEGEGEVPAEGEGEISAEGEGETQLEGEGEVTEGEVSSEGEVIAEGEPVEGEIQNEGENAPTGCCSSTSKNLSPKDLFERALGDWLLVGISLITLASLPYSIKR